ncbi:MAG: hypothetical protein JSV02_07490 [Dehalococcoidia bacterium]|nr:MAG: hypothetical protein JSV02_07490 [Dehalococcoidia bacterium]
MKGLAKSIWLPLIIPLAIIIIAALFIQSCNKEGTMNEGNKTMDLDISIPSIDTQVPEVIETATFALG